MKLTQKQGEILLRFARDVIAGHFLGKEAKLDGFSEKRGVFVTLTMHGQLRGCIGIPRPYYPLNKAIREAALSAALNDPRFPPLKEDELGEIDIEVSVLTVPQKIEVTKPDEYPEKIKIGDDGLIVNSGFYSGLLLPQVFTEYGSTPEEALDMTCRKAGLPTDAWKSGDVEIYKFQAQIFSEKK